jgi:hypothetical protein
MELAGQKFDEVLVGRDALDILGQAKDRAAKELGWKGLFLKAMSPISFAQEGVRRYNAAFKTNHPIPQTAEDFLSLGQELGYVTILPD